MVLAAAVVGLAATAAAVAATADRVRSDLAVAEVAAAARASVNPAD